MKLLLRLLLPLLAFSMPLRAVDDTSLTLVSDPGDYIGQGQTYTYAAGSGTYFG